MSVLTTVGILLLVALIMVFLKLIPGVFLLFLHYASGKYSKRKLDKLSLSFILGAGIFTAVMLILACIILSAFSKIFDDFYNILTWAIAGVFVVLGVVFPLCYYRKGKGTRLFISRNLAEKTRIKAKNTKKCSDVFLLGFFTGTLEVLFTAPLYVMISSEIMQSNDPRVLTSLVLVMILSVVILPIAIYYRFNAGLNLADFERMREKNKNFFRFLISFCYLMLAVLLITFRIFG